MFTLAISCLTTSKHFRFLCNIAVHCIGLYFHLQSHPQLCVGFALNSHASKVMLKILQVRLQQYMNCELPDVQAGFTKGRRTRDQIFNIHQIIKTAREFQKNIYFCFIDYAKDFDCVDHNKLWNILVQNTRPPYLPPEKYVHRSRSNSQNWTWNNRLFKNWERSTSRLYISNLLI